MFKYKKSFPLLIVLIVSIFYSNVNLDLVLANWGNEVTLPNPPSRGGASTGETTYRWDTTTSEGVRVYTPISERRNSGGGCSGNPNLTPTDVWLERIATGGNVDDQNIAIAAPYKPVVEIRNLRCARAGQFIVRLEVDFNNNGTFEYSKEVSQVGGSNLPISVAPPPDDGGSISVAPPPGGNSAVIVSPGSVGGGAFTRNVTFPTITFPSIGDHRVRVTVNPPPRTVNESNYSDNVRVENWRTTAPHVNLGSFVWTYPPYHRNLSRTNGGWINQRAVNLLEMTRPRYMPARDLSTDAEYLSFSPTGRRLNSVALTWDSPQVNPGSCNGTAYNYIYRGTAQESQTTGVGDNHGFQPSRSLFNGVTAITTGSPVNESYRFSGQATDPIPWWAPGVSNMWLYQRLDGDRSYDDIWTTDRRLWNTGMNVYKDRSDLYANLGLQVHPVTGGRAQAVLLNNYHRFDITCTTYNGTVVSDSHIIQRGPIPNHTFPLILNPTLEPLEVYTNQPLDVIPFFIRNSGTRTANNYSYTLSIGGTLVASDNNVTLPITPTALRVFQPTVNWTAPGTPTTVPIELCVNHPEMTDEECVTSSITVVAPPATDAFCSSFEATPSTVAAGESVALSWSVVNSDYMRVDNHGTSSWGFMSTSTNDTYTFNPSNTMNLTLTAANTTYGTDHSCPPITITVTDPLPTPTCTLTPSPNPVATSTTNNLNVNWSITNPGSVDTFTLNATGQTQRSITPAPTGNAAYHFTTSGPKSFQGIMLRGGTTVGICQTSVTVEGVTTPPPPPPPPPTPTTDPTLSVSPFLIRSGETTTISYDTGGHSNCTITPDRFRPTAPLTTSGSFETGPIFNQVTITMACDSGTPATARIQVVPRTTEI